MFPKSVTQFLMLLAVAFLFTGCAADDPLNINDPEPSPQPVVEEVEESTPAPAPTPRRVEDYSSVAPVDVSALEPVIDILLDEYTWGRGDNVEALQRVLGVTADGQYGPKTKAAHIELLEGMGWSTDNVPGSPVVSSTASNTNPTPQCTEWWDVARSAGWAEEDLPKLGRIMFKESTCRPGAISPTRDYGLTQINWAAHGGRLTGLGLTREDLLDPYTNLVQAKYIADSAASWAGCKWQPWYMSGDWC